LTRFLEFINHHSLILALVCLVLVLVFMFYKTKSNLFLLIIPIVSVAGYVLISLLGPENVSDEIKMAGLIPVGQPTIVEFMSPSCLACLASKPTMSALEIMFQDEVEFVSINVLQEDSRDEVRKYKVRSTPTFILLNSQGEETFRTSGIAKTRILKPELSKLVLQ